MSAKKLDHSFASLTAEKYLCWRVPFNDGGVMRLLVPRGDTTEHEYPMDLLFDTEEEADEALETYEAVEEAREEGWVLCRSEVIPIRMVFPEKGDDDG